MPGAPEKCCVSCEAVDDLVRIGSSRHPGLPEVVRAHLVRWCAGNGKNSPVGKYLCEACLVQAQPVYGLHRSGTVDRAHPVCAANNFDCEKYAKTRHEGQGIFAVL